MLHHRNEEGKAIVDKLWKVSHCCYWYPTEKNCFVWIVVVMMVGKVKQRCNQRPHLDRILWTAECQQTDLDKIDSFYL